MAEFYLNIFYFIVIYHKFIFSNFMPDDNLTTLESKLIKKIIFLFNFEEDYL